MATGCYTSNYLPGSFKGVPFEAIEASSEHGRRGAIGEFPFGENTAYADLGRRNRGYSLQVRFAENSHVADSQSLIAAVESPGSGILVHPTRGIVSVACKSLRIRDNILDEQGVTYGDIEFVEANDWPTGLSFGGSVLGLVATVLLSLAATRFLDNYKPKLAASHRRDAVLAQAASSLSTVRNEFSKANPRSTDVKVTRALSDFETILNDPGLLSDAPLVQSALANGAAAISNTLEGAAKLDAFRRLANSAGSATSLPGIAGTSQDAVLSYVRHLAGAYLGQVAVEQRFATVDEALRYMDVAASVLQTEAAIAYHRCDNSLFLELRRYTNEMKTIVYAKAYTLPGIVFYDFRKGVHPLIAAYSVYGDAKKHREVELSNIMGSNGRINGLVVGAG